MTSSFQTVSTPLSVRKLANDASSVIDITVSDGQSQGNFATLQEAISWVTLNNHYNNVINVKGNLTVSSDPGFNSAFPLTINGESNGASITISGSATLGNITFSNLTLNITGSITVGSNVTIDTCIVNTNNNAITFGLHNTIKNSTVSCAVTSEFSANSAPVMLRSFSYVGSTTFIDANNKQPCFIVLDGYSIEIDRCTFNMTFDPIASADPNFANNIINSNNACIYTNDGLLSIPSDINIHDCVFTSTAVRRYPFISFELVTEEAYSVILSNINISNNKFLSLNPSANDVCAAVAIVSNVLSAGSSYPYAPKLENVTIKENYCNADQGICVAAKRNSGVVNIAFVTQNVLISNNLCGYIGFMNQWGVAADFPNYSNSHINPDISYKSDDKNGSIIIDKNSCKFIGNLDNIGQYISFSCMVYPTASVTTTSYSTGPSTVSNNNCSWISVGVSTTSGAPTKIIHNSLTTGDSNFLSNFTDTANSITPPNVGIVLRTDQDGSLSLNGYYSSLISGNNFSRPVYSTSGGISTSFTYTAAIVSLNSSTITNNTIGSVVVASAGAVMMYLGPVGPYLVTNNGFYRSGAILAGYIGGPGSGATNVSGKIIENYFDSTTPDVVHPFNMGINFPAQWVFRNNTNQTAVINQALVPSVGLTPGFTAGNQTNLTFGMLVGSGGSTANIISLMLNFPDKCTITNVTVYSSVYGFGYSDTAVPAHGPAISIYRSNIFAATDDNLGSQSINTAGLTLAQYQSLFSVSAAVATNNIVDNSTYTYNINITDEYGTNAHGSTYDGMSATIVYG